ncbi:MAG: undecaprenyl-diphosphate phosphatase [Candidatus Thorarchaeota archaeon]
MIEYIIIAILQGLFEWLPISSSGQTMIVSINLFGISQGNAFSLAIWLHLGTTIAVLLKFRGDYIGVIKSLIPHRFGVGDFDIKKRNWIIYATIGTAITALPLYFIFKILFLNVYTALQGDIITLFISGLLIITGLIIIWTRKMYGNLILEEISDRKLRLDSLLSGLVQGISILPGISRSGITVSSILLEKYDQENALKLSFLMSAPVAIASIFVDIVFGQGSIFGTLDLITILIITLTSFLIGYLTIGLLLLIAKKINFGYFCVIYGVIAYLVIIPFLGIS